jgi:hypothetical protein
MSIENDDDDMRMRVSRLICETCDAVTDLTGVDPQYLPSADDAWYCPHCTSWNNAEDNDFDALDDDDDDDDDIPPTATHH